jgi:hypothetical protein
MPRLPDPLPADVQQALQRGDRVDAVRRLRQHTGLPLKEALAALRDAGVDAAPDGPPDLAELLQLMLGGGSQRRRKARGAPNAAKAPQAPSAPTTAPEPTRHAAGMAPGEVPRESNTVWLLIVLLLLGWVAARLLGAV